MSPVLTAEDVNSKPYGHFWKKLYSLFARKKVRDANVMISQQGGARLHIANIILCI
jgi:hypothetical protein